MGIDGESRGDVLRLASSGRPLRQNTFSKLPIAETETPPHASVCGVFALWSPTLCGLKSLLSPGFPFLQAFFLQNFRLRCFGRKYEKPHGSKC